MRYGLSFGVLLTAWVAEVDMAEAYNEFAADATNGHTQHRIVSAGLAEQDSYRPRTKAFGKSSCWICGAWRSVRTSTSAAPRPRSRGIPLTRDASSRWCSSGYLRCRVQLLATWNSWWISMDGRPSRCNPVPTDPFALHAWYECR